MTPTDTEKITKIIVDMLIEFQKEQKRIQSAYDNGLSRLSELQENLHSYKESEDVDFKVFSPRKISTLNEEKLNSMDSEMKDIEEENKYLLKQLKYYTDKVEKLLTVQAIIDGEIYEAPEKTGDTIDEIFHLNSSEDKVSEKVVASESISTDLSEVSTSSSATTTSIDIPGMNEYDKKSLVDNLERLSHRIEVGTKIIDNDIYRTKMELKSIKSGIDDIISVLK